MSSRVDRVIRAGFCWSYLALVLFALFSAWQWLHKPKAVIEKPAPAVRQADNSLVAEKQINPEAKPKQIVPKGAKVERVGTVKVQPKSLQSDPDKFTKPCPPIGVDWSLVRNKDGSRSMVTSSEDGTVTEATDVVVETNSSTSSKWSLGVAGSSDGYAALVTHEIGRMPVLDTPVEAMLIHVNIDGRRRNYAGIKVGLPW